MRLNIATHNQHKTEEIAQALSDLPIECISQAELGVPAVDETGMSFIDNALFKAHHLFKKYAAHTLADDSGIVVPFLQGAPGVHSARYAGMNASDTDNNIKLLSALAEQTGEARKAHFVCVLIYVYPDTQGKARIHTIEEHWHGHIAHERSGEGGFGYDSIFIPHGMNHTAAHLTQAEKTTVSHRGKALAKIRTILAQQLADTNT